MDASDPRSKLDIGYYDIPILDCIISEHEDQEEVKTRDSVSRQIETRIFKYLHQVNVHPINVTEFLRDSALHITSVKPPAQL